MLKTASPTRIAESADSLSAWQMKSAEELFAWFASRKTGLVPENGDPKGIISVATITENEAPQRLQDDALSDVSDRVDLAVSNLSGVLTAVTDVKLRGTVLSLFATDWRETTHQHSLHAPCSTTQVPDHFRCWC
jgi:hypothetical protein